MRSRFAILWIALTAVVAGIAAYIAYGAGVSTHLPEVAAGTAAGTVAPGYYYPYWHPFFGFGFFGFFFLIFAFFIVIGLLRAAFGRGRWHGHGGWKSHAGPRDYLEDWHKQAHGESPPPEKAS